MPIAGMRPAQWSQSLQRIATRGGPIVHIRALLHLRTTQQDMPAGPLFVPLQGDCQTWSAAWPVHPVARDAQRPAGNPAIIRAAGDQMPSRVTRLVMTAELVRSGMMMTAAMKRQSPSADYCSCRAGRPPDHVWQPPRDALPYPSACQAGVAARSAFRVSICSPGGSSALSGHRPGSRYSWSPRLGKRAGSVKGPCAHPDGLIRRRAQPAGLMHQLDGLAPGAFRSPVIAGGGAGGHLVLPTTSGRRGVRDRIGLTPRLLCDGQADALEWRSRSAMN